MPRPLPSSSSADSITRVPGVLVGQAESRRANSGVTVLRFRNAAPTVVGIRGGASGTYDTGSLALEATFGVRDALFFAGGSVHGLDAGSGVRERILETGGGARVYANPHRIARVSGAVLFDLPERARPLPDYRALGYEATRRASRRSVEEGRVGAGTGARVGKYAGYERSMPGGVGNAAVRLRDGFWVGALAVVNAIGAVRDPATGHWLAGARSDDASIVPPGGTHWSEVIGRRPAPGTTLVAVATDHPADRGTLQRVAAQAEDGAARAIVPSHTATDGDVVFVTSTALPSRGTPRERAGGIADRVGAVASELVIAAIARAVRVPDRS